MVEKMTSAVSIAAGLSMLIMAVMTRISGNNTEMTFHWIGEISMLLYRILLRRVSLVCSRAARARFCASC